MDKNPNCKTCSYLYITDIFGDCKCAFSNHGVFVDRSLRKAFISNNCPDYKPGSPDSSKIMHDGYSFVGQRNEY